MTNNQKGVKIMNFSLTKIAFYSIVAISLGLGNITKILATTYQDIFEQLDRDCHNTVEIEYNSEKLQSLDGETTVYFNGTLRRLAQDNLYGYETCPPLGRSTPKTTMIVETSNRKINIEHIPDHHSQTFRKPLSFSPNGRYLVVEKNIAYEGGDGETDIVIYDLENNYQVVPINICPMGNYSADFFEYKGFILSNRILFQCSNFYGTNEEWIEIVNIDLNTNDYVSYSNLRGESYGTIIEPLTIIKRQVFTNP